MGHTTMKLANSCVYRRVQGLDFRVLMFLAQATLDHDNKRDGIPARTWFGGIAPIVEFIYDTTPDDPGYRAKYTTVQQSLRNLIRLEAIQRTTRGVGGNNSVYEICPLQGTLL